jgi:hypothetical protein
MDHFTIYRVTNLVNGRHYIGKHQTKDLSDDYMGSGKLIRAAIKKYGRENFKKEILFVFETEQKMNEKEAELVTEELIASGSVYNLCPGGHGGFGHLNNSGKSNIGWKTNHQGKEYQRRGGMNGWRNPNIKEYAHLGFAGKSHTDGWKEDHSIFMKENQKGSKNSQFGTMWITNGTENRKVKKDLDSIPEGWYKGRKMKS